MGSRKQGVDQKKREEVLAMARRNQQERSQGYREQALRILPHVCGRCGREFAGKGLSELTVHHVDHNHDNNPTDGSNWELLCRQCHDREHHSAETLTQEAETRGARDADSSLGFQAFAGLKDILKDVEPDPQDE